MEITLTRQNGTKEIYSDWEHIANDHGVGIVVRGLWTTLVHDCQPDIRMPTSQAPTMREIALDALDPSVKVEIQE